MHTDVYEKLKRKNQILFTRDSVCLQRLLAKMGEQNDRTLVLWALECCRVPVKRLKEHFPEDERPQRALEASTLWSMGKIKMPEAKRPSFRSMPWPKMWTPRRMLPCVML